MKDVQEIAKESRIKLQVDISQFYVKQAINGKELRFSDANFKFKTFADVSTEYSSCHQCALSTGVLAVYAGAN